MNRVGVALALMLIPGAAFAGGGQPQSVTSNSWNGTITDNWNQYNQGFGGSATSGADASATSGAGANASTGPVSNNVVFGGTRIPRQAPGVSLGVATAYCQNNGGIGGSGPGFSVFGFMGRHDKDCIRFNHAMLLEAMGYREQAVEVLKNNPEVAAAFRTVPVSSVPVVAQPIAMAPIVSPGDPGYRGPRRPARRNPCPTHCRPRSQS